MQSLTTSAAVLVVVLSALRYQNCRIADGAVVQISPKSAERAIKAGAARLATDDERAKFEAESSDAAAVAEAEAEAAAVAAEAARNSQESAGIEASTDAGQQAAAKATKPAAKKKA